MIDLKDPLKDWITHANQRLVNQWIAQILQFTQDGESAYLPLWAEYGDSFQFLKCVKATRQRAQITVGVVDGNGGWFDLSETDWVFLDWEVANIIPYRGPETILGEYDPQDFVNALAAIAGPS
jgi:hypothetical protein